MKKIDKAKKSLIFFILGYLLIFIFLTVGSVLMGVGFKTFDVYIKAVYYYMERGIPMKDFAGLIANYNATIASTSDKLAKADLSLFVPGLVLFVVGIVSFLVELSFHLKFKNRSIPNNIVINSESQV